MRRFTVLALFWALTGLVDSGANAVAETAQNELASAGIGLSRAEWEAMHGPGEPGQSYVAYEGGAYYVQFQGDAVRYIEFGWPDPGVPFAEAEGGVRELIPADAGLAEAYYAPPTDGGPIGLTMQRYTSRALAELFPELGVAATGGILAIYTEIPAPDRFEPYVSRVSITIGTAP